MGTESWASGEEKEFSVFSISHSVSIDSKHGFSLGKTRRVIDFTDPGLTSAFPQVQPCQGGMKKTILLRSPGSFCVGGSLSGWSCTAQGISNLSTTAGQGAPSAELLQRGGSGAAPSLPLRACPPPSCGAGGARAPRSHEGRVARGRVGRRAGGF